MFSYIRHHGKLTHGKDSEYFSYAEHYIYQLYLAIENINHSQTKVYSSQANGICKRFHKTMKNKCHDITFYKKLYGSIDKSQTNMNE